MRKAIWHKSEKDKMDDIGWDYIRVGIITTCFMIHQKKYDQVHFVCNVELIAEG